MRPASAPEAGWYDLWVQPAPWLAVLRELDFDSYGKISQRELHGRLTLRPDWKGNCNVRFRRGVVWCWWFRAMDTANTDPLMSGEALLQQLFLSSVRSLRSRRGRSSVQWLKVAEQATEHFWAGGHGPYFTYLLTIHQ
jgi:hypothetical protein